MMGSETIVAVAATSVALIALFVSVWQGIETRKHHRLSVTPKLSFEERTRRGGEIGLVVANGGIGPAMIEKFRVRVDDAEMPSRPYGGWKDALLALGINEPWVSYYYFAPGDALRVGEIKSLLYVRLKDVSEERRKIFLRALKRTSVVIEYKSVYGKKFCDESKQAIS